MMNMIGDGFEINFVEKEVIIMIEDVIVKRDFYVEMSGLIDVVNYFGKVDGEESIENLIEEEEIVLGDIKK